MEVDGEGSYLTAALGNTWSHCVNTRLILQYLAGDRRQVGNTGVTQITHSFGQHVESLRQHTTDHPVPGRRQEAGR